MRDAFEGIRRFGEFQKSLGAAKNILSSRLRNLVEHGILHVVPAGDGSGYQEYVLTDKGRGLFPLLVALRQWGEEFFFDKGEGHVRLVDRERGLPVRKLELRAHDGRVLTPEDTIVVPPPLRGQVGTKQAQKITRGSRQGRSTGRNEGRSRRNIGRPDEDSDGQ